MTWQMKSFFQYVPYVADVAILLWIYIGVVMPMGEVAVAVMGFAYAYITVCIYGMELEVVRRTGSGMRISTMMAVISFGCNLLAINFVEQERLLWLALAGAAVSALFVWFCAKQLINIKESGNHAFGAAA